MARRPETVILKGVHVDDGGRLPLVASHVDRLAMSIKEIGLLEPIIVCRRTKRTPTLILVAGRHRLEACRQLKHENIAAIVENEDSPEVERWRALAEIDENLIRRDLTPAQRAKLVSRRKAAYEAVHPETKHGGAPGKAGGGKTKGTKLGSFAADTAAKSGKSATSIKRDATRAKALGADLDRVAGTSLDKGAELDALAAMPAKDRAPLIQRASAGDNVSARRLTTSRKARKIPAAKVETFSIDEFDEDDGVTADMVEKANAANRRRYFLRCAADCIRKAEQGAGLRDAGGSEVDREVLQTLSRVINAWSALRSELKQRTLPPDRRAKLERLPLNQQVNRLVRKLSDLVDDYSAEVSAFLNAHPDLDAEGKKCISHFILIYGNELMSLEQRLDGR